MHAFKKKVNMTNFMTRDKMVSNNFVDGSSLLHFSLSVLR